MRELLPEYHLQCENAASPTRRGARGAEETSADRSDGGDLSMARIGGHVSPAIRGYVVPCYHFHVHDDEGLQDEEGIDLPDFATAQAEAIRLAGGMLLDDASLVQAQSGWHLWVKDEDGRPLMRVEVNVVDLTTMH